MKPGFNHMNSFVETAEGSIGVGEVTESLINQKLLEQQDQNRDFGNRMVIAPGSRPVRVGGIVRTPKIKTN